MTMKHLLGESHDSCFTGSETTVHAGVICGMREAEAGDIRWQIMSIIVKNGAALDRYLFRSRLGRMQQKIKLFPHPAGFITYLH
jgi:hypothetical protein